MQGYLEASNVNIVEEMVNLITAQRAYEINRSWSGLGPDALKRRQMKQ